ncbi:resuscitation-promoting factor [Brachybacterium sp. FME24]|uniref:resuscitation-promoting factor n=1 Tax=Brachybacterium sp. FME24 TaxID=2742605 RepID=UPI002714DA64|nr:resuscitation-promoting factor [Brachybacterium sp. FME24]
MKKTPWIVAAATVCVVGLGGGGTAFAMSNEAAVSVYGEQSMVRTFSPTVAELLEAQGIEVKDTDMVVPDLAAQVTDGIEIQIIQRTPITVSVDGQEQEVLATGDTVADALEDVDYEAEGARVSPAPETELSAETAQIDIVTRKTVTFKGQQGQDTFEIAALTVDEAMTKLLGDIEDTDTADVPRDSVLEDGATITIQRVREAERTETEEIPFETKTVKDDELLEGTTKTTTEGEKGSTEKVFAEKTVDGEVTESELVSEEVVTKPVAEVITKGTKPKPEPKPEPEPEPETETEAEPEAQPEKKESETKSSDDSRSGSTSSRSSERSSSGNSGASAPSVSGGSVWDRLAQCESGGDWSINTGNGFSGGLQFTKSTWLAFGGGDYAPVAHQATREQQIVVAKKVQAGQGWGAWPSCTSQLGIR